MGHCDSIWVFRGTFDPLRVDFRPLDWKSILYKYQTSFGFESRFLAFGNHFRPLGVIIGICKSILGLILDLYESTLGFLDPIFCHFKFIYGDWESI